MRDDLHKGAPVAQRWRSVIRLCTRDADWSTSGPIRAEEAIVADIRRNLSANFVAALGDLTKDDQSTMLPSEALRPHVTTQLDGLIVNYLSPASSGKQVSDAVADAVMAALDDWNNRTLRAAEGHIQERAPADRPEMMRRLRNILERVELSNAINDLVVGQYPKQLRKRIKPVTADESLPLGPAAMGAH